MAVYNDEVSRYITGTFTHVDTALQRIYDETPRRGLPAISIKPEEGRFLQFLVRATGTRRALEIGTLGGYSGTWIARGLAPEGWLITLEKEPKHAEVAREHFKLAGVSEKVDIWIGNAHDLLARAAAEKRPFDFVFIDAEKPGYDAYLTWALDHVREGGMIAAHNAFRKGSVMGLVPDDEYTETTRQFNRRFASEPRLLSTIYPAGDGMLVGVKVG